MPILILMIFMYFFNELQIYNIARIKQPLIDEIKLCKPES